MTYLADSYGIVGDGATDNTVAINSLITTVSAAGGGEIVFSDGKTYLYGKTVTTGGSGASIVLKSNVWLSGAATLKLRDGIAVDATTSYFPIWASSVGNVRITDLTLTGNSANNTAAAVCDIVTLSGCENAQLRDVTILDGVDSGVMFSDCTNSTLDNVRIDTTRDLGVYISDTSNGTIGHENMVRGCRINGAPNGGIALKRGAQRFVIVDNTIYNCGNGITMEQGALAYFGHDSIIANNRLRHIGYIGSTSFVGIDLRGCDYVQLNGNRIDDVVSHGIMMQAARYCTVSQNVLSGVADGIRVKDYPTLITTYGTSNCSILGNIVNGTTGAGVNFISSAAGTKNAQLNLSHNQFLGCATYGVLANANLDRLSVHGNFFQGATADASVSASATNLDWRGTFRLNGTGTVLA